METPQEATGRTTGAGDTGRAAYSVAETARMFGVSEVTIRRAVRSGRIPTVDWTERVLIPARWVEQQAAA